MNPPKEDDLTKLEELRRTLIAAWEERRHKLTQAQKLQVFKQQADQADSWLASKQAFLNNDDLGVSASGLFMLKKSWASFSSFPYTSRS